MGKLAFLVVLVLLSSCSFLKPKPAPNIYVIEPANHTYRLHKSKGVFFVRCINTSSRFRSRMFYYRFSEYGLRSYADSEWADPPCRMLSMDTSRALEESGIAKVAFAGGAYVPSDYTVLISIRRLGPVFNAKESYVVADVRFVVVDDHKNAVVIAKTFRSRKPIKALSMKDIVGVVNSAVGEIVGKMIGWLESISW